jgi:hypothetical protein
VNAPAVKALARMVERADALGHTDDSHYLWPACQWGRFDPTKPLKKWDTAWRALRGAAGLPGLRFHDLRHTVITELAELGVADHVLESISGHLSRKMLEHYSHNEVAADGRYKGVRIEVSGVVGDIKNDILNNPFVTLGTGAELEIPKVQCSLAASAVAPASRLHKGDRVTVSGTVSGLMFNVLMTDCTIH